MLSRRTLVCVSALSLIACSGEKDRAPLLEPTFGEVPVGDASGDSTCPYDPPTVLFVGNSYTFWNDMPAIVGQIAGEFGCTWTIYESTIPGVGFAEHLQDDTVGVISEQSWDAVVLQNQSQRPGLRLDDIRATSLPNAQALADLIRDNDEQTELVYFNTWGRENGDADNCGYYPLVCDFEGHSEALVAGYALYAEETGGVIAPVGQAWSAAVADPSAPLSKAELFSDGTHPSVLGSLIAALVLYETISGHSPMDSSVNLELELDQANYARLVASEAVGALE